MFDNIQDFVILLIYTLFYIFSSSWFRKFSWYLVSINQGERKYSTVAYVLCYRNLPLLDCHQVYPHLLLLLLKTHYTSHLLIFLELLLLFGSMYMTTRTTMIMLHLKVNYLVPIRVRWKHNSLFSLFFKLSGCTTELDRENLDSLYCHVQWRISYGTKNWVETGLCRTARVN